MIEIVVFDSHQILGNDGHILKYWQNFLLDVSNYKTDLNIPLSEYNASQEIVRYGNHPRDKKKRRILTFKTQEELIAFKLRWS